VIAVAYENPNAILLGFCGPDFDLPKVIGNLFPPAGRCRIRSAAGGRIRQREARKLGVSEFDPYALYNTFGLNAVRSEVLEAIADRLDFDPRHPSTRDDVFRTIR